MEYIYYKDKKGNFGDDLNGWMWPRIFGKEDLSDDLAFLGIGTILYEDNRNLARIAEKSKIVFGTGVRPVHRAFSLDNTWDIRFLRGPLSANQFDRKFDYISDAAYALKILPEYEELMNIPKKYEVSFIPYFKSESYYDWKAICKDLGIHYITTHTDKGVDFTLREIAASKCIISEAMHGAILADVFRIPWKRFILTTPFTEGERISEFKWADWMNSVDIFQHNPIYVPLFKKGRFNSLIKQVSGGSIEANVFLKKKVKDNIYAALSDKRVAYSLSPENRIQEVFDSMAMQAEKLNRDLQKALVG
ncbi:polysaccharide pyruvyl transferase family protein [Echinicola sp. CAU 1574]|uniref:Polysaccharide pyruvyl transferase family protein n=1 Tax=Echinicola arenosa TaxID=2774144 RepID=A0ABR9AQP8_9BACT|nr:polysaccharide pyruvyl transferase family protein [Echinicola arenosa]MBD8490899.1 polysaccharide pyruvyl transferase family protein [Echinicola arenosa]